MKDKVIAIILSAGVGKRMNNNTPKQYIEVEGRPIIYYTIKAFMESNVDEIVLVVGENEVEYCTKNIVQYFNFNKIKRVVQGGKERYNSVYNGLQAVLDAEYVLIHDGARPCISVDDINRMIDSVKGKKACIMAVKAKDSIKIVKDNIIVDTPNRDSIWHAQTPQAFEYEKIYTGYKCLIENNMTNGITDDAMVWMELYKEPVQVIEGKYSNIKVTTPEDLEILKKYIGIEY